MKKDNRGLSLVELVIVISIMAVLGGLVTVGVGLAVNKSAEETAKKIVTTLNNARISTMGKRVVEIQLYCENDSVFAAEIVDGAVVKTTNLGSKGVEVSFCLKDSGWQTLGGAASPLKLSFQRSSGGFKKTNYGGTEEYCTAIKVKKGSKEMTVKLEYLTGKVFIS